MLAPRYLFSESALGSLELRRPPTCRLKRSAMMVPVNKVVVARRGVVLVELPAC